MTTADGRLVVRSPSTAPLQCVAHVGLAAELLEASVGHDLRRLRGRMVVTIADPEGDALGTVRAEGFGGHARSLEGESLPLARHVPCKCAAGYRAR